MPAPSVVLDYIVLCGILVNNANIVFSVFGNNKGKDTIKIYIYKSIKETNRKHCKMKSKC